MTKYKLFSKDAGASLCSKRGLPFFIDYMTKNGIIRSNKSHNLRQSYKNQRPTRREVCKPLNPNYILGRI